jgi:putative acetyltransferase
MKLHIRADNLQSAEIQDFLSAHIDDMRAISPPESKHALDIAGLLQPNIQFWCAYNNTQLVGCIALKIHSSGMGEIKSMRTAVEARGKGIGLELLRFVTQSAKQNNLQQLYLETGAMTFFEPARKLYKKFGFEICAPFANYKADPNSVFMTKRL